MPGEAVCAKCTTLHTADSDCPTCYPADAVCRRGAMTEVDETGLFDAWDRVRQAIDGILTSTPERMSTNASALERERACMDAIIKQVFKIKREN